MLYDGKYGNVEPGGFKDYIRRAVFLKRQQTDVTKHLSLCHAVTKNIDKANSTLTNYLKQALPYMYGELDEQTAIQKAAKVMKELEGKVIEFTPLCDTNNLKDPFAFVDKDTADKGREAREAFLAKRKDKLAVNRK